MASNPFNGVATFDGGDFSSTDVSALIQKFDAKTSNNQIDLLATLGTDWNTVAQGSGVCQIDAELRLELDANYQYIVNAWSNRTTITAVVRPRTGVAAVGNPQVTVTFAFPDVPMVPTVADTVLVYAFSVRAITWEWTNGTLTVTRPS